VHSQTSNYILGCSGALEPKFRRRWQVAMKLEKEEEQSKSRWEDLQ
jgi:hypothetical protein